MKIIYILFTLLVLWMWTIPADGVELTVTFNVDDTRWEQTEDGEVTIEIIDADVTIVDGERTKDEKG